MSNIQEMDGRDAASRVKWVLLSSLIILIIGCIGYFSLSRGLLISYIFAHLGALGLLGLFGGAAGFLALRKRRSFWLAFSLCCLLPIFSGLIAVIIAGDSITCGGSISLAVAVLMTGIYALLGKKARFSILL